MARGAVVAKGCPSLGHGEFQHLGIVLDLVEAGIGEPLAHLGARCLAGLGLGKRRSALRVAQQPLGVARDERDRRVGEGVADRKDDTGVERPQPPARQRIVQLLDAVPLMTVVATPVTLSISS